jgi:catechol 2,3-dioxygenase-like lactoylglutathione lyase family enzyme
LSPKIESVNHAQITIPKNAESEAREFYCGFLGLRELQKPVALLKNGGFWLDLGAVAVHVGLQDGVDRKLSKNHVAYQVRGLRDWAERLRSRGIEILDGESIPGFERFEFRDPFGNRVEFMERVKSRD